MKSFEYTIKSELGLHARPAATMVKRLANEPCDVKIICGNRSANAKGLLAIMSMAVKCGETVTVTVDGADEDKLCNELEAFFKENY